MRRQQSPDGKTEPAKGTRAWLVCQSRNVSACSEFRQGSLACTHWSDRSKQAAGSERYSSGSGIEHVVTTLPRVQTSMVRWSLLDIESCASDANRRQPVHDFFPLTCLWSRDDQPSRSSESWSSRFSFSVGDPRWHNCRASGRLDFECRPCHQHHLGKRGDRPLQRLVLGHMQRFKCTWAALLASFYEILDVFRCR